MYREIIELKSNIDADTLKQIKNICIAEHDNRAGKIDIKALSNFKFVFECEEKHYGCLDLGWLALSEIPLFMDNVKSWKWEDEDPDESCNLLEVIKRNRHRSS